MSEENEKPVASYGSVERDFEHTATQCLMSFGKPSLAVLKEDLLKIRTAATAAIQSLDKGNLLEATVFLTSLREDTVEFTDRLDSAFISFSNGNEDDEEEDWGEESEDEEDEAVEEDDEDVEEEDDEDDESGPVARRCDIKSFKRRKYEKR